MSSIYSKAFKIGVALNLIAFGAANLVSYWVAYSWYRKCHENLAHGINFSGGCWLGWGFPFYWADSTGIPFILNILIITLLSFVLGFTFRFLSGKRKSRTYQ